MINIFKRRTEIMQMYISGIAVALLMVLIGSRALLMRKKGIRVIVFGRTDKSDYLVLPVVLLLIDSVFSQVFGLPMWNFLVIPFWYANAPGWVGLALCAIALVGIAVGLISFKDSFRVGIDESKPDVLITTGLFALSRNPLYVCFALFFFGMFLVHRNVLITFAVILFPLAIHRQILREEVFLKKHYGDEYENYCKKVRRYL